MPGNHLPRVEKRAGSMSDNKWSPMRCSPLANPHISLPSSPTHRYPGVLQSLCCRDALGWVYGQHLVDEIFCFRGDRVPLRGGELPKQRDKGERWQRDPLHLGCFCCNLGQAGQMDWKELPGRQLKSRSGRRKLEGWGQDLSVPQSGPEICQCVHLGMAVRPTLCD